MRRAKAEKPIMAEIYSVHLQPRYEVVMKPPMNGASKGPMKTVAENTATANPRVLLLNMSVNAAATTARGHEPNKPSKNRQIMIVCTSFATATPIAKIEKPKAAMTRGRRRP